MYVCMYVYISNIQSAYKERKFVLFVYRIYKEFHINLWECSMNGYCYMFFSIKVYILKLT